MKILARFLAKYRLRVKLNKFMMVSISSDGEFEIYINTTKGNVQ